MIQNPNPNSTRPLTDGAVLVASGPLSGADLASGPAARAVGHGVDELRANAGPALRELASGAEDLAMSRLRSARDQAGHLRETGVVYVRDHPLQSLLMAVVAGAGLALALGLLSGRKHTR